MTLWEDFGGQLLLCRLLDQNRTLQRGRGGIM